MLTAHMFDSRRNLHEVLPTNLATPKAAGDLGVPRHKNYLRQIATRQGGWRETALVASGTNRAGNNKPMAKAKPKPSRPTPKLAARAAGAIPPSGLSPAQPNTASAQPNTPSAPNPLPIERKGSTVKARYAVSLHGEATTPRKLRVLAVAVAGLLATLAILGWFWSSSRLKAASQLRENTAPALIAVQQIQSSLAEAESAASANLLSSGFSDRQQQRTYENALDRVAQSLERASRLIGNDQPSHNLLASIGVNVVRYTNYVEHSRTTVIISGADSARNALDSASQFLATKIRPQIKALSTRATTRFNDDAQTVFSLEIVLLLIGLIAVLSALAVLAKQSRRLINVFVGAGAVVLFVSVLSATSALLSNSRGLRDTEQNALKTVQRLGEARTIAYQTQTKYNQTLTNGADIKEIANGPDGPEQLRYSLDEQFVNSRPDDVVGRALATEVRARWDRYGSAVKGVTNFSVSEQIKNSTSIATAFTGFNIASDALLVAQEQQVITGLEGARNRLRYLPLWMLLAPLLAAVLATLGIQQRINEYR
jgi:CHASE3 domain sensor protein